MPPNGQPIVMLADHPVTGGYPVIAVVAAAPEREVVDLDGRPATIRDALLVARRR